MRTWGAVLLGVCLIVGCGKEARVGLREGMGGGSLGSDLSMPIPDAGDEDSAVVDRPPHPRFLPVEAKLGDLSDEQATKLCTATGAWLDGIAESDGVRQAACVRGWFLAHEDAKFESDADAIATCESQTEFCLSEPIAAPSATEISCGDMTVFAAFQAKLQSERCAEVTIGELAKCEFSVTADYYGRTLGWQCTNADDIAGTLEADGSGFPSGGSCIDLYDACLLP